MDEFNNNEQQFTQPVPPVQPEAPGQPVPPVQPQVPTYQQPVQPYNASQVPPQPDTNPGAQGTYQQAPYVPPTNNVQGGKPVDGLGIASLVLGILGLICCWLYGASIIFAIVGLILGLVAKKDPATGKRSGFALAGIIVSAIAILLCIVAIIMFAVIIADAVNSSGTWSGDYEDFFNAFTSLR